MFKKLVLLFGLSLLTILPTLAQNVDVTGSNLADSSFASLKDAFTAINNVDQAGKTIQVLVKANTTETASAILNAGNWTSLLVRPQGKVTITSNFSQMIHLNGADNVTIDGRRSGGDTLLLACTNTLTNQSIVFSNTANNNTLKNFTLTSSYASATNTGLGIIHFASSTLGSNNNTIESCYIGATSLTSNVICSVGNNSFNTVSNCQIYRFRFCGVRVDPLGTNWTVQGTKFYQPSSISRQLANAQTRGIQLQGGKNHLIQNNIIGHTTALGTGTMGMTAEKGINSFTFAAIDVTNTADSSIIRGNKIGSISFTAAASNSSTFPGVLTGIKTSGKVLISNNIIGDTTGTSKLYSTSNFTNILTGIYATSSDKVTITGNKLGGLSMSGSGAAYGIYTAGTGAFDITGNTVGNSTANNIVGNSTLASGSAGICITSTGTANISDNIVQNLYSSSSANTLLRGISILSTSTTQLINIANNKVVRLTSAGAYTSTANGTPTISGILLAGGIASVTRNTISGLSNTNTTVANTIVNGILYSGGTNTLISQNNIYDLKNAAGSSASITPSMSGILLTSNNSSVRVFNNMISVGKSSTQNVAIAGIQAHHQASANSTIIDSICHNTINISGVVAGTTGTLPSFGIARTTFSNTAPAVKMVILNNIVKNNRSGALGKHYAIGNNYGTTASATGWPSGASNFNFFKTDTATTGYWNSSMNFPNWRANSAGDDSTNSGYNVIFQNDSNDLHLKMGATLTPIESGGLNIASIKTDYDGDQRPGPVGSTRGWGTKADIGADEFDGVQGFPPCNNPAINMQTLDTTILAGNSGTFSIDADGDSVLFYQWQLSLNNGMSFSDVSDTGIFGGSKTGLLSITNAKTSHNKLKFQCIITDRGCSSTTDVIILTTIPDPIIISNSNCTGVSLQGFNGSYTYNGLQNGKYSYTSPLNGGSSIYFASSKWHLADNSGDWFLNDITDGLTPPVSDWYATGKYASVNGVDYAPCTLPITVNGTGNTCLAFSEITTEPVNKTVAIGGNTGFQIIANEVDVTTYKWQVNSGSGAWSTVGTNSDTLALPAVTGTMNGNQYRCLTVIGKGVGCIDTSVVATLFVSGGTNNAPVLASLTDISACANSVSSKTVTFTDETPATVTLTSSNNNSNLINSIVFSGSGASRTATITPKANATGTARISIFATDASGAKDTVEFNYSVYQPDANALSSTMVSCYGNANGAASVNVTGGSGSLKYSWTPGNPTGDSTSSVSGLIPGTWICIVSDQLGCSDTVNFEINQPDSLYITGSATDAICFGSTTGSISTTIAGGTQPYGYTLNGNSIGSNSIASLAAGTYELVVNDFRACSKSASFTISEPIEIIVAQQPVNAAICNGFETSFTVSASNAKKYRWQALINGEFRDILSSNTSYSGASTATLTVKATDGLNNTSYRCVLSQSLECYKYTDIVKLTVNRTPAKPSISYIAPQCSNAPEFTLTQGSPAGGTYTLDGKEVNAIHPGQIGVGTYILVYTIKSEFGCANSTFQNFTVKPTPVVEFTKPDTLCSGTASITLTGGSPAGGKYSGEGVSNGMFAPKYSGAIPLHYTFTNSSKCTATASTEIVVLATPKLKLPKGISICANAPALNLSSLFGNKEADYTIQFSGTGVSEKSFNPEGLSAGNYYVKALATSANGCQSLDSFLVVVKAIPSVSIDAPASVCNNGEVVTLYGLPAGGEFSGTGINGSQLNPTQLSSGNQSFQYSYTAENGCTNTAKATINILSTPAHSIDATKTTYCKGETVVLKGGNFTGYQWFFEEEKILEQTGSIYEASEPGNYQLLAKLANGCSVMSETLTLKQDSIIYPVISYTGSPNFCSQSSIVISTQQYDSYQWMKNGKVIEGETAQNLEVSNEGSYSVLVNSASCQASSLPVSISERPGVVVSASRATNMCQGESVTFTSTPASKYSWMRNGVTIADAHASSYSTKDSGNYSVVVTDAYGCTITSMPTKVSLIPLPAPVVEALGETSFCPGGSVVLTTTTAFESYRWKVDQKPMVGAKFQKLAAKTGGNYRVYVKNSAGCYNWSEPVLVRVKSVPENKLSESGVSIICEGDTLVVSGPSGMANYQWLQGSQPISNEVSQSIGLTSAGSYRLRVENDEGCSSTSNSLTIFIKQKPTRPVVNFHASSLVASDAPNYQWYKNGSSITGAVEQDLALTSNGAYAVAVTNDHGCKAFSEDIVVSSLAIDDEIRLSEVVIYPNPVFNFATIEMTSNASYFILDVNGKQISNGKLYSGKNTIDTRELAAGVYQLQINNGKENRVIRMVK